MKTYPVIGGNRTPSLTGESIEGEYLENDPTLAELYRKFHNREPVIIGMAKFYILSIDHKQNYIDGYDENCVLHRYKGLVDTAVMLAFGGPVDGRKDT